MHRTRLLLAAVSALALLLSPVSAGAFTLTASDADAAGQDPDAADDANESGEVELLKNFPFLGGAEVDYDGRYAYVGQASLNKNLGRKNVTADDAEGGIRIIDLEGGFDELSGETFEQFDQVGFLDCPGTDNYVRLMDPEVFNADEPDTQYIVVAHHGNACTMDELRSDPRSTSGYGARNGIMIVDVTDRTDPQIVDVIGHKSAHTVMPHPTRPYIYILPGGTANGTERSQLAPTGIIDASDPTNLVYVNAYEHNAQGCHDLGWTIDGDYAYCAGLGEVQVWDVSEEKIEDPVVVNTIVNPAIQFAHNAVVSPDGKYMLVNDEAFGTHTCSGTSADLYGSLWIYDISIPDLPILAGRISPPERMDVVPSYAGWAQSWCAAHNYNFVPGTNVVVASWFAGGATAHDISNPLMPELIAAYQPDDGVMWSAHYYGGYVVTGDMQRGVDIVDMPALRALEDAAKDAPEGAASRAALGAGEYLAGPQTLRKDMTDVLVPSVLPPRDARRDNTAPVACTIPSLPA